MSIWNGNYQTEILFYYYQKVYHIIDLCQVNLSHCNIPDKSNEQYVCFLWKFVDKPDERYKIGRITAPVPSLIL